MEVGDLVKWKWHLSYNDWETTEMKGIVVNTRTVIDHDKQVRLLGVFLVDGSLCEVREDTATVLHMELVT